MFARARSTVPALLAAAASSTCGTAPSDAPRDLLAAIPADACVVVSTIDASVIRQRVRDNHFAELVRHGTWHDLGRALGQLTRDREVGPIDVDAALADLDGEVAMYVRLEGPGPRPEIGLLVEARPDDVDLHSAWRSLVGLAAARGDVEERTHGGATLHVTEQGEPTVFIESDTLLGFVLRDTDSVEDVVLAARSLLDAVAAGDARVASTERYRAAFADRASNPLLRAWVDVTRLADALSDSADERDLAVPRALGLLDVQWAALDVDLRPGEHLDVQLSAHVPEGSFVAELLGLLGDAPVDLLDALPESAHFGAVGALDVGGLLTAILRFQEAHAPRAHRRLTRSLDEAREELGVDLRADVLKHLTGEFAATGIPLSLSSEDVAGFSRSAGPAAALLSLATSTTLIVPLADADAARRTEESVRRRLEESVPVGTGDLDGVAVHLLVPDDPRGSPVRPHWAIADGRFLLSTHGPALARTLEHVAGSGSGASFADRPEVAARLGSLSGASVVGVTRTRVAVDSVLGILRAFSMAGVGGRDRDLEPLARVRWPSPLITPDLFRGTIVHALRIEGDRVSISIAAR